MTAQPYPAIHVHAVKPFAGGQEWTISQDDLLHARTLLEVARDIPIPALDAPMPTEPHYPDQGKFWFSWPVNVGPAPASAPASTTTNIQQPVAATSSLQVLQQLTSQLLSKLKYLRHSNFCPICTEMLYTSKQGH